MSEMEIKRANRRARCDKRAQLHDQNRATKRAREKVLRAIADRADVFGVVDIFLHRNDLATLDYANDKTRIQLTRKDDNAPCRGVGFTDAVAKDYDAPDDDYEDDEDDGYAGGIYDSIKYIIKCLRGYN